MRNRTLLGIGIGLAMLSGCGSSGPQTVDVSGTVTWKGEPVDGGHIRFIPVAPTSGPVTGSHIVNGRYEASGASAVAVGSYRVEITWLREATLPPGADDAATPVSAVIPARYNTQSELTLTVPAGSGSLTHDFTLTP